MKRRVLAIVLIVVVLMTAFASLSFAAEEKGTGLYKEDGKWKYYENGVFAEKTGLVLRPDNNTWHYVKNGVYKRATGLVKCVQLDSISTGKWYYVENGDKKDVTGMVRCIQPGDSYGKWYYVVSGKRSKETGMVKVVHPGKSTGLWFYAKKGKWSQVAGIVKSIQPESKSNGKRYYVNKGRLDKEFVGVAKDRNDKNLYYVKNGKPAKYTGYAKYGDITYLMAKGKKSDVTGIRKKDGEFVYIKNGKVIPQYNGALTIDGVQWVVIKGKATKVTTESDKTLYRAMELLVSITDNKMTDEEKLKKCFDHLRTEYWEGRPRTPHYRGMDWPVVYANDIFVNGGGNCFSYGAAFAYLAKAIGYTNVYACNSGGHGWAEVNGLVYDPEWSKRGKYSSDSYFGTTYSPMKTDVNYKAGIAPGASYMRIKI